MPLAGSLRFASVMRVPPFDQNASNGSVGAVSAVPLLVLSNSSTGEPEAIGLSLPAFQSAIVSSFASSWHSTSHASALTLLVTASRQASSTVFFFDSRSMNFVTNPTLPRAVGQVCWNPTTPRSGLGPPIIDIQSPCVGESSEPQLDRMSHCGPANWLAAAAVPRLKKKNTWC